MALEELTAGTVCHRGPPGSVSVCCGGGGVPATQVAASSSLDQPPPPPCLLTILSPVIGLSGADCYLGCALRVPMAILTPPIRRQTAALPWINTSRPARPAAWSFIDPVPPLPLSVPIWWPTGADRTGKQLVREPEGRMVSREGPFWAPLEQGSKPELLGHQDRQTVARVTCASPEWSHDHRWQPGPAH